MTEFGDYEPEDAWDRADPPAELLANLARRLVLIHAAIASGRWTIRDQQRFDDLTVDLDYVIGRL